MRLDFRALSITLALVASASGSTAAFAQSAPAANQTSSPAATDTVSLTDEQRMKIIDGNTEESAAAARGELPGSKSLGHGIHGEVGVMIGSNGSHGVYGAAEVPLGNNATAAVSFENETLNYRRRR